jgi:hypothetical protein
MKCVERNPESSYQECELELDHSGSHRYLSTKWSRPEPAEPDWDVQELLDTTLPRNAYGVEERSFPIVVVETVTRVIWVEAETEDQALAYWGDDPTDLSLDGSEVLDGSLEFERPDKWQRQAAFQANRFQSKIGPLVLCPGCGAEAFRRNWIHAPYRKCHGPIEWRESQSSNPRFRWRREFRSTPVYDADRQAVSS